MDKGETHESFLFQERKWGWGKGRRQEKDGGQKRCGLIWGPPMHNVEEEGNGVLTRSYGEPRTDGILWFVGVCAQFVQ